MNPKEKILPTILRDKISEKENEGRMRNLAIGLYQNYYTLLEKFGEKKHIRDMESFTIGGVRGEGLSRELWRTPEIEVKKNENIFKISVFMENSDFFPDLNNEEILVAIGHFKNKGKLFKSTFLGLYQNGNCLIRTKDRTGNGRSPAIEDLINYQEFCEFLGKKLAESGGKAKGGRDTGGAGSY